MSCVAAPWLARACWNHRSAVRRAGSSPASATVHRGPEGAAARDRRSPRSCRRHRAGRRPGAGGQVGVAAQQPEAGGQPEPGGPGSPGSPCVPGAPGRPSKPGERPAAEVAEVSGPAAGRARRGRASERLIAPLADLGPGQRPALDVLRADGARRDVLAADLRGGVGAAAERDEQRQRRDHVRVGEPRAWSTPD